MAWKYVFVKVGNAEVPVIFPERMVHALMVECLRDYFAGEAKLVAPNLSPASILKLRSDISVLSAGSAEILFRHAGGHSESIGIVSRPDDQQRLNTHPYTGGFL